MASGVLAAQAATSGLVSKRPTLSAAGVSKTGQLRKSLGPAANTCSKRFLSGSGTVALTTPSAWPVRRRFMGARADGGESKAEGRIIKGPCFVLGDNIDTDQIIPAEYLTLLPSVPEEYEQLGSYALAGLPAKHALRFVEEGQTKTKFPIIVAGANFGCGSSREHAPVALGAAGCQAVVAESYARIFFRNSVATGELYPVEVSADHQGERLCDAIKSGDVVTVDLEHDLLIHEASGKQFPLLPIGEAGPVIDAGGIFNYARMTGMIASKA